MNTVSENRMGSARQTKSLTSRINRRPDPYDDEIEEEISEMSSAGQAREERDQGNLRSSRAFSDDCADLVHEMANTTAAVLMNVQVVGWKLPPYSRLKRPLREIERNAQRGGELMKRLLLRLTRDGTGQADEESCVHVPKERLANTVTAQGPGVDSGNTVNLPPRMNSHPAPVFSSGAEGELTARCDGCTSTFPKKE